MNISLDLEIDNIYADQNMLSIILRNLITNAIKYSIVGGDIIVSARKVKKHSIISVTDFGIGMDNQRLQRLFKSDFIESKKGTKGEKGTGIGLSLCKEFVEKHGGSIKVESEINKGSVFTISFPIQ